MESLTIGKIARFAGVGVETIRILIGFVSPFRRRKGRVGY
jgi:hypothetical protein